MQITVPSPQKLRKVGNSFVLTIPADFAEQHGLKVEDLFEVALTPLAVVPKLRPALARNADRLFAEHREALEYLRDN
jgi:antitoxin component of MazEF toxin-antitoxin module